jgi:carboxy-terminal domain RNA polymerase II polypeptide A small phosphatase
MSTQNGISNKMSAESKPVDTKSSLFSRILRVLVPCISSSSHAIEFDSDASKEKSTIKTDNHPPPQSPTPPPSTQVTDVPPEISVTSPPAQQIDPFVPPTPPSPTLLPLSETEGVTSGAVQAPGSTGDTPAQHDKSHTRDSIVQTNGTGEGEESEGTSFTEDEDMDGLDDLEDEEEKLIMDGGAGIPIGPVSSSFLFPSCLDMNTVLILLGKTDRSYRTASQNRYCHPFLPNRLAENASSSTWTRP